MKTPSQHRGEASAYRLARGTWPLVVIARARVDLPMDASAAATGRRAVDERLSAQLSDDERGLMQLLVSEVVTNAVVHSGAAPDAGIALNMAVAAECIRAEVADAGPGFRPAATPMPRPDGQHGWGLFMVNGQASRWGAATKDGSCVWFELDRGAEAGPR